MSTITAPQKQKTRISTKPAVHKSKQKVRLALPSREARHVSVAGGFNGWCPQPLVRDGDGSWSIEIELPEGAHEYLFVVDDQWLPDPSCHDGCPNPFGGENSVLRV